MLSPPKFEADFMQWLTSEMAFSNTRSYSNLVSRLRRVSKFVNVDSDIQDELLLAHLEINENFRSCSLTVKSQLRKSLKAYRRFLKTV